ncbi:MAG: hypothetical protein KF708_13065 [Pirellulales bacterium]|nr:hypothetical protein [Pirellulales bacterium]
MSVDPAEIEAFIAEKIALGQFQSREEFFVAAARLYCEMECRETQLQADIAVALDEPARGLSAPLDVDSIKSELAAELEADGRDR